MVIAAAPAAVLTQHLGVTAPPRPPPRPGSEVRSCSGWRDQSPPPSNDCQTPAWCSPSYVAIQDSPLQNHHERLELNQVSKEPHQSLSSVRKLADESRAGGLASLGRVKVVVGAFVELVAAPIPEQLEEDFHHPCRRKSRALLAVGYRLAGRHAKFRIPFCVAQGEIAPVGCVLPPVSSFPLPLSHATRLAWPLQRSAILEVEEAVPCAD